ncbi:MAG: biopolymer transporter ExbD [Terriglobales bacterium]|jgi:biopolymer transport protein TolR
MHLKRHRPNQLICNINIAGFASVMLALLYMFICRQADAPGPQRWIPVDMPKAAHSISMRSADREDAMIVAITRDDRVFFRGERISPDQLPARIRESVNHGSENKVYIGADAHAKYEWVAEVLDGVRSAGVERIGFLVYERRPVSAPNPQ